MLRVVGADMLILQVRYYGTLPWAPGSAVVCECLEEWYTLP